MKKAGLSVAALVALGLGSASAADLGKVYTKAPPPAPAVAVWDVAFGAAVMNNYVFRGVSQSNRNGSVAAYFEPRYNITPDLQLYAGVAGESISFRLLFEHWIFQQLTLDHFEVLNATELQQLNSLLKLGRHHQLLAEVQRLFESDCHFYNLKPSPR